MIKSIELKNFKSIKSKFFPFSNLNILSGLNGMGKSSLIQALLVLRQSELHRGNLKLNSEAYVKLGSTKDVLYQYSKNQDLEINLKFDSGDLNMRFNYIMEADYFEMKIDDPTQLSATVKNLAQTEALLGENFQYLNANRINPTSLFPKSYGAVVNSKNIGNSGEYSAHFIEVYSGDDINFDNLLHSLLKHHI